MRASESPGGAERVAMEVAVVIPAFLDRATLRMAVRSALEQTHPPREVVVVDDGSPEDLHTEIRDLPVRYVRRTNGGPAAARNQGIALTEAPFVAFLDADDLWEPRKLEVQSAWLLRHPDAVGVCCEARVIANDVHVWNFSRGRSFPERITREHLLIENAICNSTAILRRDILERCSGLNEDRRLVSAEDYDLWLRATRHGPFVFVPEPLASYRDEPGRLCRSEQYERAMRTLLRQLAREPGLQRLARRRMVELDLEQSWHALGERDFRRAVLRSSRAILGAPFDRKGWKMLFQGLLRVAARDPRRSTRA